MNNKYPRYVIITPAYNEEATIGKTIKSVVKQTVLPLKWIIVNDGSTDTTAKIIKRYIVEYQWIKTINKAPHNNRNFASKVECFNLGYQEVKNLEFEIIGNLDADITFGSDYFEYILTKFLEFPELGVAGTPFTEGSSQFYNYDFTSIEHVSGACQIFRRACYNDIGGYTPVKAGGIDWIAVTTARMRGWSTRTFTGRVCYHHRKIGTGNYSKLRSYFKYGEKDYYLGGHPIWEVFRSFYQMTKKPYVLNGIVLFSGYLLAWLKHVKRPISDDLIQFHRKEQINRLGRFAKSIPPKLFK